MAESIFSKIIHLPFNESNRTFICMYLETPFLFTLKQAFDTLASCRTFTTLVKRVALQITVQLDMCF